MKLQEKGTFEYLKRKKKQNLLIMLISFAVVFAVFFAGLAVFKSRNNYCTLIATVLVLPAAKFAVAYFVLLPHKSATQAQKEAVEAAAGALTCCYDCVFSNSKSPIGTQAVVVTDNAVCALTQEEKADKTFFETSLRDFLKNEKLAANVTLYTDEKTFLNRVRGLAANFDDTDKRSMDRMEWITHAMKNMCL